MTSLIKKTLLGSLILIGVLLVAIFAFGSADPLKTAIPYKIPSLRNESVPSAPATLSSSNVTEEVARQIAEELVALNPDGPGSGEDAGLQTADPEMLTDRLLSEAFKEINTENLRPVVTLNDLVVIKSNDKNAAAAYFSAINAAAIKNFPPGVSVDWENPEQTNFNALISAYGTAMQESLAIPVPQSLAELHRQYVSLLGAEKNTLSVIKNYKTDPAQAAVAITVGESFTKELESVLTQMNAYMLDHGITLSS